MDESLTPSESAVQPGSVPRDAAAAAIGVALSFPGECSGAKRSCLTWPSPPANWKLGPTDVHLWAVLLDWPTEALARFGSTLAPSETDRAERFRFPRHRDRFIASRGCLRGILASYLGCDAAELEFGYGPNGKPALAGRFSSRGFHFNQAHSQDLMLVAVTQAGPVGIDVERIRALPDAEELVARFFSRREAESFRLLSEEQRTISFFNLWTRKEAWLKATGEGIAHSLSMVEVAFLPGEPARLLSIAGKEKLAPHWNLHELNPAIGYAAALATPASITGLSSWRWPQPATLSA